MICGPDTTSRFAGEMDRYADRLDEAAAAGDAANDYHRLFRTQ